MSGIIREKALTILDTLSFRKYLSKAHSIYLFFFLYHDIISGDNYGFFTVL